MTTLTRERVSPSEWIDRGRALGPTLDQHRDESEQQRHMAQAIFEGIRGSGILEITIPRAFGGPQAGPIAQARGVEELGQQDAAAACDGYIWAGSGVFAAYLAEEAARVLRGGGQGGVIG